MCFSCLKTILLFLGCTSQKKKNNLHRCSTRSNCKKMIGKINTGNFASGLFDYLERDKSEIISKNMLGETKEELTKEFLMCAEMNQRISKPVKHFVISFSDQDNKLPGEKLEAIVKDYLKEMNYDNSQYVAYLHTDSNVPHLHIVTNRIDYNGKSVKDNHEKRRSRAILMKLEQKYNLTKTPKESLDKSKNRKLDEIKMEDRLHADGKATDKETIKDLVNETLDRKVWNEEEFKKLLKKSGVEVKQNKAGNGYKFEYKGREYKASSIDRNLSFKRIGKRLEENKKGVRKKNKGMRR